MTATHLSDGRFWSEPRVDHLRRGRDGQLDHAHVDGVGVCYAVQDLLHQQRRHLLPGAAAVQL